MYSGVYVPIVLLGCGAFLSLLWGRFWLPHTPLGALHNWPGVKIPETSFQFQKGRTTFNHFSYPLRTAYGVIHNFPVPKPYNRPPRALKCNRTGDVLVYLRSSIVGGPVNLNDYTVIKESEIYYSAYTKEWVLGSVRFSELGYCALQAGFGDGWARIKAGPITEKHLPSAGVGAST